LPRRQSDTGEFADFFHTDDLPERPGRPRSHRGAIASPVSQRLIPPATAVVVVVVVILLLVWINGKPAGKGPGAGVITAPTPRSVVPSLNASGGSPAPVTSGSPAAVVPPASSPHHRPSALTARAPVTVLNNSRITGLAASVASELRAKRWNVIAVGNLQHLTPETTLYYPPGERAAARHLAHDFGQIQRIVPNSAGGFDTAHLTLVVTRNWS
jgi:hypothetical protein